MAYNFLFYIRTAVKHPPSLVSFTVHFIAIKCKFAKRANYHVYALVSPTFSRPHTRECVHGEING
jgi:hypothetical protein